MDTQETTPLEPTVSETVPGFHPVVYETTGTVVTFEEYQGLALDMIHADLFGSFLVCGTLVGIALLWRFR